MKGDTGFKPFKILKIQANSKSSSTSGLMTAFEVVAECEYESGCIAPWSLHRIQFYANGEPAFSKTKKPGMVCWNDFPEEEGKMNKDCDDDDDDVGFDEELRGSVSGRVKRKMQEENMSVRSLYKVKGEETYCRKVGKNREGRVVIEIVGGDRNAQLMAVDSDVLEEVVPYTVKVKNFSSVNANEYYMQVKEGSVQLHDLLVVVCDSIPKFVEVVELDTKSRQYHEPKKVSKIVLQDI